MGNKPMQRTAKPALPVHTNQEAIAKNFLMDVINGKITPKTANLLLDRWAHKTTVISHVNKAAENESMRRPIRRVQPLFAQHHVKTQTGATIPRR